MVLDMNLDGKRAAVLVLFCVVVANGLKECTLEEEGHGWQEISETDTWLISEECTIDRVPMAMMSADDFSQYYHGRRPVVMEGSGQEAFSEMTNKRTLLNEFGNASVLLSTANTVSHKKTPSTLKKYLENMVPLTLDSTARGNETLYLFGPLSEVSHDLRDVLSLYKQPEFAGSDAAFAFGIGASGSGVPFHVHGEGFSEVVHGRKRWLLYPPDHKPGFDPDATSAEWLARDYPKRTGNDRDLLQECTIGPGDVLYFPSMWWHAIVNVGETVFVSSFVAKDQQRKVGRRRMPFGP